MTNLLASITIVLIFPVLQTNCHANRTVLTEVSATDSIPNGSKGIKLIHADAQEFSSITWINRLSEIKVINNIEGQWYFAGMESLDAEKVTSYLTTLAEVRGSELIMDHLVRPADEKIIIEGTGLMKPVIITVYGPESNRYLLHSTHAPKIAFISDSCGIYKQIFSNLKALWP